MSAAPRAMKRVRTGAPGGLWGAGALHGWAVPPHLHSGQWAEPPDCCHPSAQGTRAHQQNQALAASSQSCPRPPGDRALRHGTLAKTLTRLRPPMPSSSLGGSSGQPPSPNIPGEQHWHHRTVRDP